MHTPHGRIYNFYYKLSESDFHFYNYHSYQIVLFIENTEYSL